MADDDAERKHGAEVMAAMDSVLSELQDLDDEVSAGGADATTDQRESSICKAIYDLGNAAASPETARMGSSFLLPSTARFVEASKLEEGYHAHGVVVKARDSETGETVALKTLPSDDEEEEEEDEEKFTSYNVLREACFMAACRGHPSLVRLSGIARHPHTGHYCLVMEHVGPSLYDVMGQLRGGKKPFPEHSVRRVMRQVLSGAKAMHDRGVVHHDINSMSVFVAAASDADGGGNVVVKIGDYGAATSMSESQVGFPARLSHVAPECLLQPLLATNNDEAVDSWAMGCLMLELLTGEDHFNVEGIDDDDNYVEVQLQRIDEVLGLSDKTSMEAMKPAVDVELSPEVQRYRLQRRGGRLRELVPREVLSDRGFAVLLGLLIYSPKARLTASSALQLPWFTDTFDEPKPTTFTWVLVAVAALFFLMVFVYLL